AGCGPEPFFRTGASDLPTCYTREMRDRPAWQECLQCRAGGIRSYTRHHVSSIGKCASRDAEPAEPEWAYSRASTFGRFESDADYRSGEFATLATRLQPTVQKTYQAARAWI